ncbi:MAG: sigma-B regulation protein RsbU (phosphoserine phosphatase) [Candidatus Azotimanducaceae bacterium]|jgi:sigma-B regulation protein RsbU (phosphoserine phosphatase)
MSLLVLDPDIADKRSLGNALYQQMTELGLHTLDTSEPRVAASLASQGSVELVAVCNANSLKDLPRLSPSVALVLVAASPMESEDVIEAMHDGVQDIWYWPQVQDDLPQRVTALKSRMASWMAAISSEITGMRSELERDQRAGQYIQMGMLPPNPMEIGRCRLQHRVQPSLILSGDFVDYFQITERYFACYVADVSGHGASSAFVTVLLKNFSRRLRREYRVTMLTRPGEILAWINMELIDQGIDKHVAMFFGIVDQQENLLHYSNAAHLPPASLVVDERLVSLEQKGKPLGLFADIEYESLTVEFPPGARLVVFSDGVLDLVPADSMADKEALLEKNIVTTHDMNELWSKLETEKIGPDDISCLMVSHELS